MFNQCFGSPHVKMLSLFFDQSFSKQDAVCGHQYFTVLCCFLQLSFSPCKMVVNQYVSQHLLKQPQNIDVICFSSQLTCLDSSVAYPFLVQGKDFLFFCFSVSTSGLVPFPGWRSPNFCFCVFPREKHALHCHFDLLPSLVPEIQKLNSEGETSRKRLGQKLRRHGRQKGSTPL